LSNLMPLLERHLASFESLTDSISHRHFFATIVFRTSRAGRFGCPQIARGTTSSTRWPALIRTNCSMSMLSGRLVSLLRSAFWKRASLLHSRARRCAPMATTIRVIGGILSCRGEARGSLRPRHCRPVCRSRAFVAFLYYTFGWISWPCSIVPCAEVTMQQRLKGSVVCGTAPIWTTLAGFQDFPKQAHCITDWTCWSSRSCSTRKHDRV